MEQLGFTVTEEYGTGVEVHGTLHDAMRINLHSRCAFRVLMQVAELHCDTGDELYRSAYELPWETWISPDEYLTVSSKVEVKYQLVGFDPDWIDAGSARNAHYTTLPPGSYTFRVKAKNDDGVASLDEATVHFRVLPALSERPRTASCDGCSTRARSC